MRAFAGRSTHSLLLPVSWSQALQGLQQAACVPEAFQELLIGRYLKREKAALVGPSLLGEGQAHTVSIIIFFARCTFSLF